MTAPAVRSAQLSVLHVRPHPRPVCDDRVVFGIAVDPPPVDLIHVANYDTQSWPNRDASNTAVWHTLLVDLPDGYAVERVAVEGDAAPWSPGDPHTFAYPDAATLNTADLGTGWFNKTGILRLLYQTWHLNSCYVTAEVEAPCTDDAFAQWQVRAYSQIRDAAVTQFYAARQYIREQIDQLRASIGAQDTLSLRQAEREDLMCGSLEWLLGRTSRSRIRPELP